MCLHVLPCNFYKTRTGRSATANRLYINSSMSNGMCIYSGSQQFLSCDSHAIGSAGVVHSMHSDVVLLFLSICLFSAGIVSKQMHISSHLA